MEKETTKEGHRTSAAFRTGVIALAFLVIGYETAVFVHHAARLGIAHMMDSPDTVFVISSEVPADAIPETAITEASVPGEAAPGRKIEISGTVRKDAVHSETITRERASIRGPESFRFNPNTVSAESLERLGFSPKQAAAIINYRAKGGIFRRKTDFAKSFVVSEQMYERLEAFIDIPLVDINRADSAAFDSLPGIGAYFAARMVSYREELGGYSCMEQLMEIRNFDSLKFAALSDLICCSEPQPLRLWTMDEDELRRHPYIRSAQAAHSIVVYRRHNAPEECTVEKLKAAGILSEAAAFKLGRCVIAEPSSQ